MLARRAFLGAIGVTAAHLVACSSGDQTLWIVTERPEALTVTINGKKREAELRVFQAFPRVDLTKGADVVIESGGALVEKRKLSPVAKDKNAVFFVEGAPTIHLVDYQKLTSVTDGKGNAGSGGHPFGPIARGEVDIVPVDRISERMVAFPKESVIAGPGDKMPAGGNVNQRNLQKYPIYRLERVSPDTVDPWDEIGPRVTHELGWDVLPGGQPAYPVPK